MTGESLKGINRLRVIFVGKPVKRTEDTKGGGHGKAEQFQFHRDFCSERSPGRCSIENHVAGLVSLEQFAVDGDSVIDCGGKWMLGSQAIEDCDDFDSRVAGDGNRLGKRAGVGVKTASVQVDENLVAIPAGQVGGSDDADRDTPE